MNEEEKREYEELKRLLYTGTISQCGKRKLIDIIEKQQKEIEKTTEKYKKIKEKHKKIKAVFKKYALDEQDWFVSTSDIIKFVKDMRKSMGIGE